MIANLTIMTVDPVSCIMLELYFAILLIANSWKTCNSQSLESRNQNPIYGIVLYKYALVHVHVHWAYNCTCSNNIIWVTK